MSNDGARDRLEDVLGLLHAQITDITAMQQKQAELTATAKAAQGTVQVTVNAGGQLVTTVIDKSFLDDHDFEDLGDVITEAAQAAAADARRLVGEMLAPINERHTKFPSFSDIVEGMPDAKDLMPVGLDLWAPAPQSQHDPGVGAAGGVDDDGDGERGFLTVRR